MGVLEGVPEPTWTPSMNRRTVVPSKVPAALCHLPSQIEVGASGERTKFCDPSPM